MNCENFKAVLIYHCSLTGFLFPKVKTVKERQILTLFVFNNFELLCDMGTIEGTLSWLTRLRQKYSKCMLMTVEDKILSDELIYDQMLIESSGLLD